MRLRAERRGIERSLRTVAVVAGALLVAGALRPAGRAVRVTLDWADVAAARADTVVVGRDGVTDVHQRAILAALRQLGHAIEWRAGDVTPLAVEVASVTDPLGGNMIRIAAPVRVSVRVVDALGYGDSTRVAGAGAVMRLPPLVQTARVMTDGGRASAPVFATDAPRRVAVFGRAGWEAKFVVAALEERGWMVDAALSVAPGVTVGGPGAAELDTTTHVAVVVLDTVSASVATAIVRFVRSGGGLVLGFARPGSVLGSIAPAEIGGQRRPTQLGFVSDLPFSSLVYSALLVRDDAVALSYQTDDVTIAARRERLGRVVQIGFQETWRWRMLSDDGVVRHRTWWSHLVSSVAPSSPIDMDTPDAAPLAQATAVLGPATSTGRAAVPGAIEWWPILLAVMALSMFSEWTSRRLAGEA